VLARFVPCSVVLVSRQSQLADAQEDGERSLRTVGDRLARDLDDLASQSERSLALGDARRTMDLERSDALVEKQVDADDTFELERHERRASVQLAISLAESERLRRVGELEHARLEGLEEELEERHVNQRSASAAVEAERARRLFSNPLGSPFARPGGKNDYTVEELSEQNRRAGQLLADSAAQEERTRRIHVSG
jgi:hypothetical protein